MNLPQRKGTPRQFRLLLVLFLVRHTLSLGVFGYLTFLAWVAGGPSRFVMGGIMVAFVAFAGYQGRKIYAQYQHSQRTANARATFAAQGK